MPKFSEQIVDDSGYQRPVEGALVFLLESDGSEADTDSPNPTWTDNFGTFSFVVDDGIYDWSARLGGVEIARGNSVIIGVPPELKGDKGDTGEGVEEIMTPAGSALVGFKQAGANAVPRTVQAEARERVSITQFGAKCDGVTDDTAAVQATKNYCASFPEWPTMIVPGPTLISEPIIVDRPVDTKGAYWEIKGEGPGAGFIAKVPLTIFDTTLQPANTDYPTTEKLWLRKLVFRGIADNRGAVKVMSGRFLRSRISGCDFKWCVGRNDTKVYSQTIMIEGCQIHECETFWTTLGAYNTKFDRNVFGATKAVFKSGDTTRGVGQFSFTNNICEVMLEPVFVATGVGGFYCAGNYFENNAPGQFVFNPATRNGGITFTGNFIISAKGDFARYFNTESVNSIGNAFLFQDNNAPMHMFVDQGVARLVSMGDVGGPIHDSTYSVTMNGITRAGTGEFWSSNGRQITKSDDGRFGFGGDFQPLQRVSSFAQNSDGTSAAYSAYNSNGIGQFLVMDDGRLRLRGANGELVTYQQTTAIAPPDANTSSLKTAVDAIRTALTNAGITP